MKLLIVLLGFIFFVLSPLDLHAAPPPPSEAKAEKVVKLSTAAALAYDNGKYKEALKLYRKAHALWAHPKLSFAIVKCLEALGRYQEALTIARRGLSEQPNAVLKARILSKIKFLQKQLTQGRIRLLITPSGARIVIDGKVVGKAPIEPLSLSAGKHQLEISHPNYAKIVQGITIKGGATLSLSLMLQPLSGKLSITSTPSGAQVHIDGKPWGKTPLTNLSISTGTHLVRVQYPGYAATTRRVDISPQQAETIAVVLSQSATRRAPPPPEALKGPWYQSWPGWTTFAFGAAAGIVGGIFLVRADQSHRQILSAAQKPESTTLSHKALTENWGLANTEEKAGYVLVASGGGLVVLSLVFFIAQVGTGTPKTTQASVRPPLQRRQADFSLPGAASQRLGLD